MNKKYDVVVIDTGAEKAQGEQKQMVLQLRI